MLKKRPKPSQKELGKILSFFQKQEDEKAILRSKGIHINYVNPITYPHPQTGKNMRIWALGSRIFHSRPAHETFHEFILNHLRESLGQRWWEEQLAAQEKHFLFQGFIKFDEWRMRSVSSAQKVSENVWYAAADGWSKMMSSLAFDVCTLQHTTQLPDRLLSRLRNRQEYQGAHYEIAIAAIFARLGCKINFLDDGNKEDLLTPHCEFIATHKETGVSLAVEVKSRHKPGVKNMEGSSSQEVLSKGNIEGLYKKALAKNPKNQPFIIFIDVNCPPTPNIPMMEKTWFKDIKQMMAKYPIPTNEKPEEYTAVFFTNFSSHYNKETIADSSEFLAVIPVFAKHPMPSQAFGQMLTSAVQNYGFVPNFEENIFKNEE